VARQLRELGFDAVALKGGYNAWRARYPIESKQPLATTDTANYSGDQSVDAAALEPQPVSLTGDNDDVE
jgi:hypothetical protein